MLTFVDGPAAGKTMMLRSAPPFLRVTRKKFALGVEDAGEFDALDQPADVAGPDEELFVYEKRKHLGNCHMRFGGKERHKSGFYPVAEYGIFEEQPADAYIRDNAAWAQWCNRRAPLLT